MTNHATNKSHEPDTHHAASNPTQAPVSGAHTDSPGPAYVDTTTVNEAGLEIIKNAESLLEDVGTTIHSPSTAKTTLIRAHEKLCRVFASGHSGVDAAHLEHKLTRIEALIDTLDTTIDILTETRSLHPETDTDELAARYQTILQSGAVHDVTFPTVAAALDALPTANPRQSRTDNDEEHPENDQTEPDADGHSDAQALLRKLESAVDDLGRVPTSAELADLNGVNTTRLTDTFGSFDAAIDASRIDLEQHLIESLIAVADQVGHPPLKADVDAYGAYDSARYESEFKSWTAAWDAADLSLPADEALLDELERLQTELGFAPTADHVEQHGDYPVEFYRRRFDSVKQATVEAGLDVRQSVLDQIREVTRSVGQPPTTSDFDEHAVYSNSYIYDFFDSWGDATDTAGVATEADVDALLEDPDTAKGTTPTDTGESGQSREIHPSPLLEYYELFRNLVQLQTDLFGPLLSEQVGAESPMARWHSAVVQRWGGEPGAAQPDGYGHQIHTQPSVDVADYRAKYGADGVLEQFSAVNAARVSEPILRLISAREERGSEDVTPRYLPQSPRSGQPLPVIVESEAEFDRAMRLLQEFPTNPDAVDAPDREEASSDDEPSSGGESSSGNDASGELTDINGVTETVADALREAGYNSRGDLEAAEMEELSEVDGVTGALATRIKLIVGG